MTTDARSAGKRSLFPGRRDVQSRSASGRMSRFQRTSSPRRNVSDVPSPEPSCPARYFPEALRAIEAETDAELWRDEMPPPRDVLLDKVRGVDGLLCLLTDGVDAELMDAAGPQLKVVSQIAVGFDNIDIPEATRRGIAVGNTPDVLTQTTADATFTLMLAAARKVVEAWRAVQEGRWRTWHPLHFPRPGRLRRHPGHRRNGPHRVRGRQARPRLRHGGPVLRHRAA